MVRMLFADFLDNAQSYEACRNYWNGLVQDVAESLGQGGDWESWISPYYADGKTLMALEDNPIADRRSQSRKRAFRVLQHPPLDDELELVAWLTPYEEEYPDIPEELVLNMSLSDVSADLARTLLRKWMSPETTFAAMKAFIREKRAGGS